MLYSLLFSVEKTFSRLNNLEYWKCSTLIALLPDLAKHCLAVQTLLSQVKGVMPAFSWFWNTKRTHSLNFTWKEWYMYTKTYCLNKIWTFGHFKLFQHKNNSFVYLVFLFYPSINYLKYSIVKLIQVNCRPVEIVGAPGGRAASIILPSIISS